MADFIIRVKVDPKGVKLGTKKVEGDLDRVQKKAKDVGKVLAQAFSGAALVAGVGLGIKVLAEFSQEMSTVKAITGATEDQFKALREEAKLLGATTRFSASQAAQGMKFLARAGFDTNETLEAIGGTLKLAQAGALDLASAADIASNVLTGFRLDTSEMSRVVDVLAKTANSANTDVRQLGDGMKLVAPVAAGLGITLEETAAAIGTLSDAGLQGTLAGTGLRRVLSEMEAPSTATAKRLNDLRIRLDEVRPSSVGLTGALQRLKDAGVDTGLALELFGDRGGPASEVLKEMIPRVTQLKDSLDAAGGTADRISEIMDDNLNGALLAVKSAFEAVIIAFGEVGTESVLTNTLLGLSKALRTVANDIETTGKLLVSFSIAVAAIRFAPMLQGLTTSITQFVALRQAVASGSAVMLGSVTADAQKAASGLAVAQATARESAASLASANALRAKLIVEKEAIVSSGFRIATIQKATALEAKHAINLNAVTVAQARSTVANKAATVSMFGLGKSLTAVRAGMAALAINPITIGLIALAAAIATVTWAFREFGKVQKEIERIEEKTYRMRLKRLQAQVKDIQVKKQATKNLDAFITGLNKENDLMELSVEGRQEREAIDKALGIAQRALTREEKESIVTLIKKRTAIAAAKKELQAEKGLLESILGPQREFNEITGRLTSLLEKGLINKQQHDKALKELKETYNQMADPIAEYIQALRDENALLKLTSEEQEIKRAVLEATSLAEGDLTDEQKKLIESLIKEQQALGKSNEEMERLKNLMEEIKGPQADLAQREADLITLRDTGAITLREYNDEIEKLRDIPLELGKDAGSGFRRGLDKIKESLTDVAGAAENLVTNAFRGAEDALVSFVTTGKADFKGLIDSMLADLTRLLLRQALLSVIPGFQNGGSFIVPDVGFQHGGSFTVPGHGGPDSQTVAFNATPRERVTVQTPQQQQSPQISNTTLLKIINQLDSSITLDHMKSAKGEEIYMNYIKSNPDTINRLLGR